MRPTHNDQVAYDVEIEDITIPVNTGPGVTIDSFVVNEDYHDRIISYEILENTGEFEVSKVAGMATRALTRGVGLGFSPPAGRKSLESLFVRSTAAAVVAAVLVMYTAEQLVDAPSTPSDD